MFLLTALLLAASTPIEDYPVISSWAPVPDISLSAVRLIDCGENGYGSGTIVGEGVIATALHVAELPNCVDFNSKVPLRTYHTDNEHDFALMAGDLPKSIPPMRVSCSGFQTNQKYVATGYSGFGADGYLFRQYVLLASETVKDVDLEDRTIKDLRHLIGFSVPGMSGGAIINYDTNRQIGIVNVGWSDRFGKLVNREGSTDLKNTILCKPHQTSPQTDPKK